MDPTTRSSSPIEPIDNTGAVVSPSTPVGERKAPKLDGNVLSKMQPAAPQSSKLEGQRLSILETPSSLMEESLKKIEGAIQEHFDKIIESKFSNLLKENEELLKTVSGKGSLLIRGGKGASPLDKHITKTSQEIDSLQEQYFVNGEPFEKKGVTEYFSKLKTLYEGVSDSLTKKLESLIKQNKDKL